MTDHAAAAPDVDADDGTFAITPTAKAYLDLAGRVERLESGIPATVPADASPDDLARLNERLDRHRSDIEDIKGRWNALIRFLGIEGPAPTTTTTPESYQ